MNRESKNFEMFSGDDLRLQVEVRDQNGNLIDISSATEIEWQMARDNNSAPEITKTLSGGGIAIADPNTFQLDIGASETGALRGSYYHEAEVETDQGKIYTAIFGRVTIRRDLI